MQKNISIPDNITEIGKYAFSFWSCLETVKLPDGITKIGNASFRGCKNLRTINLPNTVTSIVGGPFEDCEKLEYIKIPYGVTDISGNCFANCKSLKRVYLPKSITNIGSFVGCSSLTEIIIPNNVKNISSFSFSGCNSLKKVYIPNNITSIDYGAFFGSDKITDVYYGGNKAQWDKIDINNENGENNSLLNAAIHYNSAIPVEPMLFITNYTDTSVTVETVNISNLRTTVVLAVYEKNGALRFMTTKSAADAVRFNDIDLRNSNIKVMLWSDMDSAKPLAETAEMSL